MIIPHQRAFGSTLYIRLLTVIVIRHFRGVKTKKFGAAPLWLIEYRAAPLGKFHSSLGPSNSQQCHNSINFMSITIQFLCKFHWPDSKIPPQSMTGGNKLGPAEPRYPANFQNGGVRRKRIWLLNDGSGLSFDAADIKARVTKKVGNLWFRLVCCLSIAEGAVSSFPLNHNSIKDTTTQWPRGVGKLLFYRES